IVIIGDSKTLSGYSAMLIAWLGKNIPDRSIVIHDENSIQDGSLIVDSLSSLQSAIMEIHLHEEPTEIYDIKYLPHAGNEIRCRDSWEFYRYNYALLFQIVCRIHGALLSIRGIRVRSPTALHRQHGRETVTEQQLNICKRCQGVNGCSNVPFNQCPIGIRDLEYERDLYPASITANAEIAKAIP